MRLIVSAVAAFLGIVCIATILLCRRYVRRAFDAIDKVLEQMLSKDLQALTEISGENRLSKLTHKARRVMDRCISEVAQTQSEKETIQGFISDMSHQMKTPLAGIAMYTDLLLEGNLSVEEQAEFVSRMKAGTEKLQWIMDSLIKMSRLEVGTIQIAPQAMPIKQTLLDAIGSVVGLATLKNISISVSDFQDAPLYHDTQWTREAFVNVLENAVKYSSPDGTVNVSVVPLPLYTKVVITDEGVGIAKSDFHLIFKRFYRGQNVHNKEGAGLGLYLATLILEKQGGYIVVDSVVGQGTSFSLFLKNI